jgi:3-oxoadipate enol-lactonase
MSKNDIVKGYVEADGARLYYERSGGGPDLVFIHAGIADRRMWDPQFDALAERFRVTRYDGRGCGETRKFTVPFSPVRDLAALMSALDIDKAHIVAASQGGGIALDYALDNPSAVLSLVLVAPAVGGYQPEGAMPPKLQELIEARRSGDLDRAAGLQVEIWADGPNRESNQVDEAVRERVRVMGREALELQAPHLKETGFLPEKEAETPAAARLDGLAAPVLVLYGDEDDEMFGDVAEFLVSKMRRARWAVIPGAAHFPNLEKPSMFNRVVQDFIDRINPVPEAAFPT